MTYRAITAAQARAVFCYEPSTGIVSRKVASQSRWLKVVNQHDNGDGYSRVTLLGYRVYLHRLVWLLHYGEWPTHQVDHIDGDRSNNRIANLRDVDHETNAQNEHKARRNNLSAGLLGVSYVASRQKFAARITHDGGSHHLGYFHLATDAHAAYVDAKRTLHQGCDL